MDRQMKVVSAAVKGVQSTNRMLMDKFRRTVIEGPHFACEDNTERLEAGVIELKDRLALVEDGQALHQETIDTLQEQLKEIQDNVAALNTSLGIEVDIETEVGTSNVPDTRDTTIDNSQIKQELCNKRGQASRQNGPNTVDQVDKESPSIKRESVPTERASGDIRPNQVTTISRNIRGFDIKLVQDSEHEEINSSSVEASAKESTDGAIGEVKPNTTISVEKAQKKEHFNIKSSTQSLCDRHRGANQRVDVDTDTKVAIVKTRTPAVLKQDVFRVQESDSYWRFTAQLILNQEKPKCADLAGVHSVICLDISESMAAGNAWRETLCFLDDYLTGLEELATLPKLENEYVSLVVFGHETNVQHSFTNNYSSLKKEINMLQLGGPSPLYGGLLLSTAVAVLSKHEFARTLFGVTVRSKIIIITDGGITENGLAHGPDVADPSQLDEAKVSVLRLIEDLNMDVFCVPVGDTINHDFLKLMVDVAGGQMFYHSSGGRVARNYYLHTKLVDAFGLFGFHTYSDGLTEDDQEDIKLIQKRQKDQLERRRIPHDEVFYESDSKLLPVIGSRVKRGPDWSWGEQDAGGPGTVVGHGKKDNNVWVTWDVNGSTRRYQYHSEKYDVLIVDEPRTLGPGQTMAVGCVVKSGKDWRDRSRAYNKGIVIEIPRNDTAVVRWENGDRDTYSFEGRGGQEIEIQAAGFEPFKSDGHVLGYTTSAPSESSPASNIPKKNKNI